MTVGSGVAEGSGCEWTSSKSRHLRYVGSFRAGMFAGRGKAWERDGAVYVGRFQGRKRGRHCHFSTRESFESDHRESQTKHMADVVNSTREDERGQPRAETSGT